MQEQAAPHGRAAFHGHHIKRASSVSCSKRSSWGPTSGGASIENIDRLTQQGDEVALELVRRINPISALPTAAAPQPLTPLEKMLPNAEQRCHWSSKIIMNEFEHDLPDTAARTRSELLIEKLREQGGVFVEAVRLTRMPMIVTDATLPNNPIIFANDAFIRLSGYTFDELMGQEPHFMNGPATDPDSIREYEDAMDRGEDANVEILQYKKDATPFRAMLFASPLVDGQGATRHHFLSYLDVIRRFEAEQELHVLMQQLENRVAARTRELQGANRVLADLVSEREMLLAEVNHRAKNSLAIASALLGVQGRRQEDPQVKALFREAQDS